MMLEGKKPFAAFTDSYPKNHDAYVIPELEFAPYVENGTFIKREHIFKYTEYGTLIVMYALPAEEWRVNAYILLWETADKTGWNESLERMQGRLLGYEEWQNDFHIENRFKKNLPYFDDIK